MRCFLTFTVAAALAVGMNTTSWSQTGSAAGAGGGASGGAGATGTGNSAGTAGTTSGATAANANPIGAGTNTGTNAAGVVNSPAAAGNTGVGVNGAPGVAQGSPGLNGATRTNANNRTLNANANVNTPRFNGYGQDFLYPGQTPFFSDPGARRQLNLNDQQFNSHNTAYQNAYARYNQAVSNLNPALTPEQREVQLQQLQQQFNQSLAGVSGSTFNDRQTLNRFNQLNRQFMGSNAFSDPMIRQQLNLSADQSRQLRTLQNNFRRQLQQFRRGAGNDITAADRSQIDVLRQQYLASLNGVLSPQQQQLWTQMVGQPYAFSSDLFMTEPLDTTVTPPMVLKTPNGTQTPTGTQGTTQGNVNVTPRTATPNGTQTPAGTQATTQGTTGTSTQR